MGETSAAKVAIENGVTPAYGNRIGPKENLHCPGAPGGDGTVLTHAEATGSAIVTAGFNARSAATKLKST